MTKSLASVSGDALKLILKKADETASSVYKILDYSDPDTFQDLWRQGLSSTAPTVNGLEFNWDSDSARILIVGNEPLDSSFDELLPSLSGVNFRGVFTAVSWLAAWRIKFPGSRVSIAVIDPSDVSLGSSVSQRLHSLFNARENSGRMLIPRTSALSGKCLHEIIAWLKEAENDSRNDLEGSVALLRSVLWEDLISNAERHHSISNVLGALILSSGTAESIGKLSGLSALFSCLGVNVGVQEENDSLPPSEALFGAQTPLLLFDDMADLWKPALGQLLSGGGQSDTPIEILTPLTGDLSDGAVRILVERLESIVQSGYRRRFLKMGDLGVAGEYANEREFILFLDLRLFGASEEPGPEEQRLFERLFELLNSVAESESGDSPAWDCSVSSKILDGLTNTEGFSTGYRKARVLLPQLISLIDPTLPIIIFSSTQDAEVIRGFRGYGNIITAFSKPVFRGALGDPTEWRDSIQRGFERALKEGGGVLNTRRQLLRFETECREKSCCKERSSAPAVSVEIFFDESGQAHESPFGIGGAVIISREEGGFRHRDFARAVKREANAWGASEEIRCESRSDFPREYAPKGSALLSGIATDSYGEPMLLSGKLGWLEEEIGRAGGEVYGFCLIAEDAASKQVFSPRHPHSRYREMLKDTLEVLLFHFQPVVSALAEGAWLGVDAATWSPKWRDEWGDFGEAERSLGIERDGKEQTRYKGLRRGDLFPLLGEVIQRSGLSCQWKSKIRRARAVQLVDFGRSDNVGYGLHLISKGICSPFQIHYLADWLVHLATQENDRSRITQIPKLEAWFKRGWIQRYDQSFQAELKALRLFGQSRELDALKELEKLPSTESGWDFDLTSTFSGKFENWMRNLPGRRLDLLFSGNWND